MGSTTQSLRVAAASDQAIFLRGLAAILQSMKNVQLIGEANSGEEAFQLCRLTRPDLLLLDLKDPLEARSIGIAIHEQCEKVRIILLHNCHEDDDMLEDLAAQRLFVFSRDVSEEEFKAAFEEVVREPELSPDAEQPTASGVMHHAAARDAESLQKAADNASHTPVRTGELMARELYMAGKIQADILPEKAPVWPDWQISAELDPPVKPPVIFMISSNSARKNGGWSSPTYRTRAWARRSSWLFPVRSCAPMRRVSPPYPL